MWGSSAEAMENVYWHKEGCRQQRYFSDFDVIDALMIDNAAWDRWT